MARKIIKPFQVYSSADSTTNPTSIITDVSGIDKIKYLITVAATVVGTLEVEFSEEENNPTTFYPLNFGTTLSINGASEMNYAALIDNYGFKWMRLSFTNNAGTGNINAWISGNSVGA
jgi:hypothetical protein